MNFRNLGEKSTFLELGEFPMGQKITFDASWSRLGVCQIWSESVKITGRFSVYLRVAQWSESTGILYYRCKRTSNKVGHKNSSTLCLKNDIPILIIFWHKYCWLSKQLNFPSSVSAFALPGETGKQKLRFFTYTLHAALPTNT